MMFFNLAKILPMNLEVVIIFKEQISKLYILALNLIDTLGAKIWDLIPTEIQAPKSDFSEKMTFKKMINWTPKSCPCRLCSIYIGQIGFIN